MSINFYHYLDKSITNLDNPNQTEVYEIICLVQGGFAVFGTDSSILWTMSMALYMFVVVVLKRPEFGERLYLAGHYIICWGLPAIITIVFGFVGWLGFEPETTPGWCDIKTTQNDNDNDTYTVAPVAIRYSLFLYTSFILLPPMFVAIRCSLSRMVRSIIIALAHYVKCVLLLQYRRNRGTFAGSEEAVKSADVKFVFIPVVFILLRVWSVIADPFLYYVDYSMRAKFKQSPWSAVLFLLRVRQ